MKRDDNNNSNNDSLIHENLQDSQDEADYNGNPYENVSCNKAHSKNKSKNQSYGQSQNQSQSQPESKLCCFGYVDYMVLASTLAIALGDELSVQDLGILSTFFAVLSDELALVGNVKSCSNNQPEETFVPPVPDVAVTCTNDKNKKTVKRSRKKIVRKKLKSKT